MKWGPLSPIARLFRQGVGPARKSTSDSQVLNHQVNFTEIELWR